MVREGGIQPNDPALLVECVTIWELAGQVVNGSLASIVELTGLSSYRQSTNCCLLPFADCGDHLRHRMRRWYPLSWSAP